MRASRCVGRLGLLWAAGLSLACGGGGVDTAGPAPVRIAAAASLGDLLHDLEPLWAAENPEPLELNVAGSNVLARQIQAADTADLFVSADALWVDALEGAGRVAERREILGNRLVLISRADSPLALERLEDLVDSPPRRLALADPEAVPAGRYARAHLEAAGLWTAVEGLVVPTLDVRAALALVRSDPELAGIVYRTDALAAPEIATRAELEPVVPIRYVAAVVAGGREAEARRFLDFLDSPAASAIVRRHGFEDLGASP